jgi:hypothetical protein
VLGLLFELLFREIFAFRCVQTDPNLANYRYDEASGRLVLLDFGATRHFSAGCIEAYSRLLRAGQCGDLENLSAAAIEIGYFQADIAPDHQRQVLDIFQAACEPLRHEGPYDFGSSTLATRIRDVGLRLGRDRTFWHTPPVDALFLHRKIGGLYLLAARLKARVDIRAIFLRHVVAPAAMPGGKLMSRIALLVAPARLGAGLCQPGFPGGDRKRCRPAGRGLAAALGRTPWSCRLAESAGCQRGLQRRVGLAGAPLAAGTDRRRLSPEIRRAADSRQGLAAWAAAPGPQGSKQVVRAAESVSVAYNGEPSADRTAAAAAALVADGYRLFLSGPFYFLGGNAVLALAGSETVDGRLCDRIVAVRRPGLGLSAEDRFMLWLDRTDGRLRRVRFTLEGLASTQGAVAEVDFVGHRQIDGVLWPVRFIERLKNRFPICTCMTGSWSGSI